MQEAAREQGIGLSVVNLPYAKKGFVLLPRRWVIERSIGWAARFRRLVRDYERLPQTLYRAQVGETIMLLQITTTAPQASDLGYLRYKNPANVLTKDLPFGVVWVFYPEASDSRCTAALWLEIDPIGLVRRAGHPAFALAQYVNDRPYVASSFLSVAPLAHVNGAS